MFTVAFTGRREIRDTEQVRNKIKQVLTDLKEEHEELQVISGMAIGIDQMIAEEAIVLDIPFIAAVPFKGQAGKWPEHVQDKYYDMIKKAAKTEYVNEPPFAVWKFHDRNKWMVNNSDLVVAFWDFVKKGGTYMTVQYTRGVKKDLEIVDLNKL